MFILLVKKAWFSHMSYSLAEVGKPVGDSAKKLISAEKKPVLAVVVLYNRSFKAVPCAARLKQWLAEYDASSNALFLAHCLIYDNSPVAQPIDFEVGHEGIEVFHDPTNGGTRAAYLHALDLARARGYEWILFLDHDTALAENFFLDAARALKSAEPQAPVGAVVPQVFDGPTLISPSCITFYGRVHAWRVELNADHGKCYGLTAIASASIVRTEALTKLLPIPPIFSLDYLDHWLFRELQRQGENILVSPSRVEHSLSVQSMKSMNVNRYRSILAAELAFLRGEPNYSRIAHLLWHMGRMLKLAVSTRRPALVGVCVRAALNILRTP